MLDLCKKIAVALAFACACTANGRVLNVDLSGQSGGRTVASLSLSPLDQEEFRSHRLEAGAAKVSGLEVGDVISCLKIRRLR